MDTLQNALPALGLLLIMVVMAIVLKRMRHHLPRVSGQEGPPLRVLSSVSLGPQHRMVTVQVGEGHDAVCLLVGVAPGAMHTLHSLPTPAAGLQAPAASAPPGFAARLAQLTKVRHDPS
ncbi:MAG TPA: flagellar biosynthetic protein FliO [Hydrogenophaga sp.]|uniref:FliO/MopB family protein n=1 Tax=Hydrogenophaga sp. TaxID=1904254 RepID=UPI002B674549|nr:flagellar biosynthetic protein FliO [Hydrogenophaga sp.]HMN92461.1 flagellar biosynthetic protein FliO [Hydrogenophaga sp.]HMP11058.1 flagellar biosynthetic protein FliO [Hydrogenophaga sp.]